MGYLIATNSHPGVAISNYVGCSGPFDARSCEVIAGNIRTPADNIGILVVGSTLKIRDVTDGTSNVFAVGECRNVPYALDIGGNPYGSPRVFQFGSVTVNGGVNCINIDYYSNGPRNFMRYTKAKLNGPPLASANLHSGFHSYHTGGAQFLLIDGSVRLVSENIDHTDTAGTGLNVNGPYGTYQRLGGINDGQIAGDF